MSVSNGHYYKLLVCDIVCRMSGTSKSNPERNPFIIQLCADTLSGTAGNPSSFSRVSVIMRKCKSKAHSRRNIRYIYTHKTPQHPEIAKERERECGRESEESVVKFNIVPLRRFHLTHPTFQDMMMLRIKSVLFAQNINFITAKKPVRLIIRNDTTHETPDAQSNQHASICNYYFCLSYFCYKPMCIRSCGYVFFSIPAFCRADGRRIFGNSKGAMMMERTRRKEINKMSTVLGTAQPTAYKPHICVIDTSSYACLHYYD